MKILVAVKRVIDYNVQVRVKEDGTGVHTDNVKMATNPPDDNAVEEAVKIKESGKAKEVVAVTIGEEKAQETVRKALAVGVDRGIHVKTDSYIEPLGVAKILKKIVEKEKPDLVFSGVKYFYFAGGIIWLNDYLEHHDISYIASNRTALHNEHDKSIAKKIIQKANIKTADFFSTEPGEHQNEMSIPIAFPLFIKPLTGGDSRGVDANSIVYDFLSFLAKVLDIKRKHNLRSLVETYLSG